MSYFMLTRALSMIGHTEAVEGASLALRETFLGWDGDKIQDIWQHAYRSRFYRGGPVLMVRTIIHSHYPIITQTIAHPPNAASVNFLVRTVRLGHRPLGH